MSDEVKLRMYLVEESALSLKVTGAAAQPPAGVALFYEWVAKKLISGYRVELPAKPGEFNRIEFTISEWWVERKNLWQFVRK